MNCKQAKLYYYDYLEGNSSVPEDISAHLSDCAECQQELERLRETLQLQRPLRRLPDPGFLKLHYQLLDRWISCEMVKPLLPSLLAGNFSAHHHTPVTAHVETCSCCGSHLEALASLQLNHPQLMRVSRYWAGQDEDMSDLSEEQLDVVNRIHHTSRKDVLTRMTLNQPSEQACEEGRWLSDDYRVDVRQRSARNVEPLPPRRRRLTVSAYMTGGIAAAVLLIVMLVLPPTVAKALDLTQVYKSLGTVKNIHIRVLAEDKQEIRNIWICEGLQARLFQQADSSVYWDERTGEIFRKNAKSTELVAQIGQAKLDRPWGLLPFNKITELPADRRWSYISDTELDGVRVQIYELTWHQMRGHQQDVRKTWRGYLDINTHLPYRIEWTETVGEEFPAVQLIMEVRYPSDDECLEAIQKDGFRLISSYSSDNSYIQHLW